MKLKIEYYGHIRELVHKSVEQYETGCTTINALLQEIQKLYHLESLASHNSSGAPRQTFLVAINANLIQPAQFNSSNLFKDGDMVAIMPPFAGG